MRNFQPTENLDDFNLGSQGLSFLEKSRGRRTVLLPYVSRKDQLSRGELAARLLKKAGSKANGGAFERFDAIFLGERVRSWDQGAPYLAHVA